jgi:two-component system chemotaxis response regulator CheB
MQEGPLVIQALEQGAVDYIQKPSLDQLGPVMQMMIEKVKTAAVARVRIGNTSTVKRVIKSSRPMEVDSLVVVGSSTGGTEALRVLFESFPSEIPPVLVVQHIPAVFSKAFADRMNTLFPFEVKEASDGDLVTPNRILIAPGGTQMSIDGRTQQLKVMIDPDASPVNRHKPSVEVLFQSAKGLKKKHLVAIMLTGMGADGAKSMKELRDLGARTIAQNEESCVVFGMPQAAIKLGGVEFVEPLDQIGSKVFDLIQKGKAA